MAVITNYATLQQAVADYLNRADLTSFLPNFTQACEMKLYRDLRIRAMETALSVSGPVSRPRTSRHDLRSLSGALGGGDPEGHCR
jgi:hypothetical protein